MISAGMALPVVDYKGANGMKRWIGLGVIANNLINIGNVLARRAET